MKLGIVGLPNVGKSTLFNSLTKAGAESANYPFCTIDPNVGIVTVPDARVDYLAEKYHSKKVMKIAVCDIQPIIAVIRFKTSDKSRFNKRFQLLYQRLCQFIFIRFCRHQPLRLW